ncbi:TetR/AcrR family transcriptional regulator [Winogradskya humida]|uniref:HTH tetR-type domain-containing protein n=1 Tax=Winogradskya humida TaxID=113566 RepID=A0ABQ3ZS33_9ACTN|nr:TetR/AcrR family transcriptional regulator [Actinoplanes humidus]GIE21405.1 hypothetical protein Ahu01nite_045070 [Actinoplanes humidus]
MTERLTRAEQQARTREKLLDSAETLFGDKGIHQTTLDEIAAAAGLTKGAIYANFGGKKDLIAGIMARKLAEDVPMRPPASTQEWIRRLGDDWETNAPTPEVRRFAMAFLELLLHGLRDQDSQDTLQKWLQTVRDFHVRDLASFDLPLPPEQIAALLVALDIGVAVQHLVDPDKVPVQTYTRGVEAVLREVKLRE